MAIHESNVIESNTGYTKTIDDASMHMALDVLQKYQYQYPQKSTIRELAANAVDSIKERDIAKLILTGKAKEEDYYIRRDNAEFKDSNFNPDYFDLNWLSDKKEVEIIYEEGDGLIKKDKLRVIDYGVGLGGNRLELYFKLNASTKRNSKSAIGKWGLGNKTPLSTGIDAFRMVSYYNGKKYAFDIYSHKIDSVTGKFNEQGELNPTEQFSNGYTFYYEVTTEKNHTEISFETKKHHRTQYTDAVRQQLLYFDNITYTIVQENGYRNQVVTKANVIYEDDDIILSDNSQYSKPHSVIGNVSYGYIQFLELELEDKQGNIGIKMNAEDVDISPSRENILWTDKTRKSVTDKFNKVVDIASREVEQQLNEHDFLTWLDKCSRVMSYNDSYSILGRLSRVIDKTSIKPTYPLDKTIKYKSPKELLYGVSLREVYTRQHYGRQHSKVEMVRDELTSWNTLQNYKLYYTEATANNLKDRYITHTQSGRFILLQIPELRDETAFKESHVDIAQTITSTIITVQAQWDEYVEKHRTQRAIIKLIIASKESIDYDALVVPDDFKNKLEESETVDEQGVITGVPIPELTPSEQRKLDEKTVLYYPEKSSYERSTNKVIPQGPHSTHNQTYNTRHTWVKDEPKISEVLAWEGTVVYAFGDEDELLLTAAWIIEQQITCKGVSGGIVQNFFSDTVKLVRISKSIKKYFKAHTHITEFFKQVNGTELSMNNLFVNWYTGKRIADEFTQKDAGLLHYLVKHKHSSPFRHPTLQFRIKCPIYVERQLFKHQIGWSANSISGRYVDFSDSYTHIEQFRTQSTSSKQGSAEDLHSTLNVLARELQDNIIEKCKDAYASMLAMGVSKEQARTILPLSLNTEFIWTGTFLAFIHLCSLRLKPDAQKETRDLVQVMLDEVKAVNKFQHSLNAFGY